MQGTRSQHQRQSAPTGPFSRRRACPGGPWGRSSASTLCLSSPDSRAGLGLGREAAGGFEPHSRRDPRRVGDPRGGWAAFRRPAGFLPPSLPSSGNPRPECAGRPAAPRLWPLQKRPFPPGEATLPPSRLPLRLGRARCLGSAWARWVPRSSRRRPPGRPGGDGQARVGRRSSSDAHPLAAAGSYRRSSPGKAEGLFREGQSEH